jgi:hypothetical protein
VHALLYLLLFAAIVLLAFERPRSVLGSLIGATRDWPAAAGLGARDAPQLAPLIRSLYRSLVSPERVGWWKRQVVVARENLAVLSHPLDAPLLRRELPNVKADLNAAVKDNAPRHRIIAELPLSIVGVYVAADDSVPQGAPLLLPVEDAVARAEPARDRPDPLDGLVAASASRAVASAAETTPAPAELGATIGAGAAGRRVEGAAMLWPLRSSGGRLRPIAVDGGGVVLGRDPACRTGRIAVATVSRRHARVERHGDGWRLVDLESHNGSYRNGDLVEAHPLRSGDVIGLGPDVSLRFVDGDAAYGRTQSTDAG